MKLLKSNSLAMPSVDIHICEIKDTLFILYIPKHRVETQA